VRPSAGFVRRLAEVSLGFAVNNLKNPPPRVVVVRFSSLFLDGVSGGEEGVGETVVVRDGGRWAWVDVVTSLSFLMVRVSAGDME
jgi:hypothetical protein